MSIDFYIVNHHNHTLFELPKGFYRGFVGSWAENKESIKTAIEVSAVDDWADEEFQNEIYDKVCRFVEPAANYAQIGIVNDADDSFGRFFVEDTYRVVDIGYSGDNSTALEAWEIMYKNWEDLRQHKTKQRLVRYDWIEAKIILEGLWSIFTSPLAVIKILRDKED